MKNFSRFQARDNAEERALSLTIFKQPCELHREFAYDNTKPMGGLVVAWQF